MKFVNLDTDLGQILPVYQGLAIFKERTIFCSAIVFLRSGEKIFKAPENLRRVGLGEVAVPPSPPSFNNRHYKQRVFF